MIKRIDSRIKQDHHNIDIEGNRADVVGRDIPEDKDKFICVPTDSKDSTDSDYRQRDSHPHLNQTLQIENWRVLVTIWFYRLLIQPVACWFFM